MQQPGEKTTARKTLEVARKVRGFVRKISQDAHEAKAARIPTSYQFIGCAFDEIPRVMGIVPVWTENFAGLCAAKVDAQRFLAKAQAEGYSPTLCSYCTVNLGFDAMRSELGEMPPNAPDGGMESPDILLGCGMDICDPRHKAYQAVRRYVSSPMYVTGFLWPPLDANLKEVQWYYTRYLVEELKGLIEFLEGFLHKKMDYDKLAEVVDISERTLRLWWDAYQLRKAIPSPMPTEDAMGCMGPGRFFLGTPEALQFYQELYNEIKQRVDNKMGVIPEEKYRIMWGGGLAPWYALRMFNYYETLGAVFAIEDAYRPLEPIDMPPEMRDPVERIAWRWLNVQNYWVSRAQKHAGSPTVERLLNYIKEYKIDGVVFHRAITCRTAHTGQIYLIDRLKKWADLPMLVLEGDIIDVTAFNEAQTKRQIDAFINLVALHKGKG